VRLSASEIPNDFLAYRAADKAFHGILPNLFKKLRLFHGFQNIPLLVGGKFRERCAEFSPAGIVHVPQPLLIALPSRFRTFDLAVDEIDDPRFSRARSLVAGNDLGGHSSQRHHLMQIERRTPMLGLGNP
jgi:hypothetical protein